MTRHAVSRIRFSDAWLRGIDYVAAVAVAVLVIVGGLIVGVSIELLLGRRQRARRAPGEVPITDALLPQPPKLPEPRFIDDGEGFRILGPMEYEDPGPGSWEDEVIDESLMDEEQD